MDDLQHPMFWYFLRLIFPLPLLFYIEVEIGFGIQCKKYKQKIKKWEKPWLMSKESLQTWLAIRWWVQEWVLFLTILGRWESSRNIGEKILEEKTGWRGIWDSGEALFLLHRTNTWVKSFTQAFFWVVVTRSFSLGTSTKFIYPWLWYPLT